MARSGRAPRMAQVVTFPSLKPSRLGELNAGGGTEPSVDLMTGEMFSLLRDRMLNITNYLEALCAQVATASNGTAVTSAPGRTPLGPA